MRVAIFIDGGYLEKIVKHEFGEASIDFDKLAEQLAKGKDILRTYYYNCLPYQSPSPTTEESERFARKERFFSYLKRLPRFSVKHGRLARRTDISGNPSLNRKVSIPF